MREMQTFKLEKLNERDHCRDLGMDKRILLILWISKKQNYSIGLHSICQSYKPVVSSGEYGMNFQVP
jgi:hypothetical protein